MGLRKICFVCACMALLSVSAFAVGGSSVSAQIPVSALLAQEKQIQSQIQEIHRNIRQISRKMKEMDSRIVTTVQQLESLRKQKEQNVQEMARQYGVILLPVLTVFQEDMSKSKEQAFQAELQQFISGKQQLMSEREQLIANESKLRAKWKAVSDQIAKTANEKPKEASLDDLPLDQLANLFVWPVPSTKEVSSDYGWRNLNGIVEFHSGIDVAADDGDPIYASADGIILYAGPAHGFGHWIVIQHQQGLLSIYGHMYRSGVQVKPGQKVRKGQVIGKVGADGQSFGPHLHFAVARGISNGLPNTLSPWYFLEN